MSDSGRCPAPAALPRRVVTRFQSPGLRNDNMSSSGGEIPPGLTRPPVAFARYGVCYR